MKRLLMTPVLLAVLFLCSGIRPALAQNSTPDDIDRLQDALSDTLRALDELRMRDGVLAAQLQRELDDLGEEAIYFKVKLRKNEVVSRRDYYDLRDRVDIVRARREAMPAPAPPARAMDVPVGTELDVRLQQSLSSSTALVEDRVEVTTVVDLLQGIRVVIPAGATLRGIVSSVNKAGRIERRGSMTLTFDLLTIRGQSYPIRGTVIDTIESDGIRSEAGRIGAGAGVGAVLGGILGGMKGAIAGVLIGGGGTMAATDGTDVDLPAGTVLRVRIDSGLDLP